MIAVPKKMVFGAALGLIGGIIALCAMAAAWDGTTDSMPLVGLNMLVAVMFFAVGGAFTKTAPVQGNTVIVLAAVCEAVVILSALYQSTELWVDIILAVIGAVNIAFSASPAVVSWIDTNRI